MEIKHIEVKREPDYSISEIIKSINSESINDILNKFPYDNLPTTLSMFTHETYEQLCDEFNYETRNFTDALYYIGWLFNENKLVPITIVNGYPTQLIDVHIYKNDTIQNDKYYFVVLKNDKSEIKEFKAIYKGYTLRDYPNLEIDIVLNDCILVGLKSFRTKYIVQDIIENPFLVEKLNQYVKEDILRIEE